MRLDSRTGSNSIRIANYSVMRRDSRTGSNSIRIANYCVMRRDSTRILNHVVKTTQNIELLCYATTHWHSAQFKMVSMRSEKTI